MIVNHRFGVYNRLIETIIIIIIITIDTRHVIGADASSDEPQ